MPKEYIPSVEKGFKDSMKNGILAGYPMDNMKVTLKDGSFHAVDSDHFHLNYVLKWRIETHVPKCGAVILEPMMKLEVLTPEANMGDIVGDLTEEEES